VTRAKRVTATGACVIGLAEHLKRFFSGSWNDEGVSGVAVEHGDGELPAPSVPAKDDVDTLALPLREVGDAARLPLLRDRLGPGAPVAESSDRSPAAPPAEEPIATTVS
jgi:hypothetical protein